VTSEDFAMSTAVLFLLTIVSAVPPTVQAKLDQLQHALEARDTRAVGALLDPSYRLGPMSGEGARTTLMGLVEGGKIAASSIVADSVAREGDNTVVFATFIIGERRSRGRFLLSPAELFVELGMFRVSNTPDGAPGAGTMAGQSEAVQDTLLRNRLLGLQERDQRHRRRLMELGPPSPGAPRSPEADSLTRAQALLDSANVDTLRAIVRQSGWPSLRRVGVPAAIAAFLVLQHAALDLQVELLPVLERAVQTGDARSSDVAVLTDRVLMRQGKNQRYGSQLHQNPGEKLTVWPIEDEAHVDERRKGVGLEPLTDYLKHFGVEYRPRHE
jgi:hypothetical protein